MNICDSCMMQASRKGIPSHYHALGASNTKWDRCNCDKCGELDYCVERKDLEIVNGWLKLKEK